MLTKIKNVLKLDMFNFVYYNYLCKAVSRNNCSRIFPYKGAKIELRPGARIVLNGDLHIGTGKVKGSKAETYCQLYENSLLKINGRVTLAYGAMVQAHHDAEIQIGETHINTRATIIADKKISIGNDILISRDVAIFDSDFHPVFDAEGNRTNDPQEVQLDDHVWLGVKTTVLRGVHIGTGAVVGANALVTKDVPPKAMISTTPGRAFGYIEWKA